MRNIFLFSISFFIIASCKNSTNDDEQIKTILQYADTLRTHKDFEGLIVQLKHALPLLRKNDDSLTCWIATNRKIVAIMDIELHQRGQAITQLQTTYDEMDRWQKPSTPAGYKELMLLYLRDIRTSLNIGDLQRLHAAVEKAEPIFNNKLYGANDDIATYYYKQAANLYVRLGEFTTAKQYFEESKNYITKSGKIGVANYNDYGSIFLTQKDYKTALSVFNEGLTGNKQNYYNQTMLFLNKAESLARSGEFIAADEVNEIAFARMTKAEEFDDAELIRCRVGYWENKGIIAEEQKKWPKALEYFRQITQSSLIKDLQRREKAAFIANEANACYQLLQYDTALTLYHHAYLQFYPASQEKVFDLPNPADLLTDNILAEVLEGKAICFAQLNQFDNALAMYELIPVVEAQLRATHNFESSSLLALEKSRRRFDNAVELAWKAWQMTHEEKYAEKAFWFTEMARGVLQNKGIRANDAYAALDETQKTNDKSLATRIAAAETELAEIENNNDPKVNTIMQAIRDLKKEQKEFRASVMKTNPAYAAEISTESISSLPEIGKLLRDGQVVLDYFMIDSLALHVFVADKLGNVAWHRLDWTVTQRQALLTMINYLGQQPAENGKIDYFAPMAYSLFHALLEPELDGGKGIPGGICRGKNYPQTNMALLIIPDMELAGLSFEALLTDTVEGAKKWGGLPYLARKFSIGYAYSASLLDLQQSITRKHKGIRRMAYAGFAPMYSKLAKIDSAVTDVQFGQKLFGGKTYIGAAGTEMQFRTISENTQILLMSMHGISDHNEPTLSKLYFGDPKEGASNQNNILTAGELQNIPCSADLAILSACDTGDGPMEKGEGVYTLSRAFTISGVPSTVMSFWKLPVVSSSNMVQDFLTGIKEKQQKDVALRTAKIKWLEEKVSSEQAHPYYWAGFVTTGDTAFLEIDQSGKYSWWLIAIGLALAGGLIWFWKRRK